MIGVHKIQYTKTPTGTMVNNYELEVTRVYYETYVDYFRAFLELLFVMFSTLFLYRLLKTIFIIYAQFTNAFLEKQTGTLRSAGVIVRYFELDPK